MNNITINQSFSTIFFRFDDLKSLDIDKYFDCLRYIKPLLVNPEFTTLTPSFYLNHIGNSSDDDGISVRLTYFTNDETKTEKVIGEFINANNNVSLFLSKDSLKNIKGNAASSDLDEELRFRKFSFVYSNIGLDMIERRVILDFRKILASYMKECWNQLCIIGGFPVKGKFEGINPSNFFDDFLIKNSTFFTERMNEINRKQLWEDLNYCPRSELCFPHFLANMFCVSDSGIIVG